MSDEHSVKPGDLVVVQCETILTKNPGLINVKNPITAVVGKHDELAIVIARTVTTVEGDDHPRDEALVMLRSGKIGWQTHNWFKKLPCKKLP